MNWLEGNTDYYSSEYLTGMEMAYPERWKKLIGEKNSAALIRRRPAFGRPVVIISGLPMARYSLVMSGRGLRMLP